VLLLFKTVLSIYGENKSFIKKIPPKDKKQFEVTYLKPKAKEKGFDVNLTPWPL